MVYLLGVAWGHVADYKRVLGPDREHPLDDQWYVEQNSGMMGVVPAVLLRQLLDDERVAAMRKKEALERLQRDRERETREPTGVFDVDRGSEEPYTRDDFVRDLKKVSRKRPSPPGEGRSGT